MDEASLRSKASQETFISLLQLEPTPIDTDKELPALPEETEPEGSTAASERTETTASIGTKSSCTSSSLGLSGSGHGAINYLSRIQRYSSYTLTIFTSIHFATTSLVPLITRSVASSESSLLLAREIYQTRLSEPLLVGLPIAAHVVSGLALRLVRRSQSLRRYGGATPGVWALHHAKPQSNRPGGADHHHQRIWPSLNWIAVSGYATTLLVGTHAFVNRGLPLLVEGDSSDVGLAFVAHGFARHPTLAWAVYGALLGVACGHMTWGWARWLGVAGTSASPLVLFGRSRHQQQQQLAGLDGKTRRRRTRMWLAINGVAVATAAAWAAGGLGVVGRGGAAPGWVGKLYDGVFERAWL